MVRRCTRAVALAARSPACPGLRLTAPEALHVTLCFLGSQPVDQIEAIAGACAVLAGRPAPGAVARRARCGCRRGARGWWRSRCEDRQLALTALQSELAATLQTGGWYQPELRPFRPHVTVARAAGNARLAAAQLPAPDSMSFVGSTIALMRSRTAPGGARYERLSEVALAEASPV